VRLRGFWGEEEPERPTTLLRTAKEAAEAGQFQMRIPTHREHRFQFIVNSGSKRS